MSVTQTRRGIVGVAAAILAAGTGSAVAAPLIAAAGPSASVSMHPTIADMGRQIRHHLDAAHAADIAENDVANTIAFKRVEALQALAITFRAETLADALVHATVGGFYLEDLSGNEHTGEERKDLADRVQTALVSTMRALSSESGVGVEEVADDWSATQFGMRSPASA